MAGRRIDSPPLCRSISKSIYYKQEPAKSVGDAVDSSRHLQRYRNGAQNVSRPGPLRFNYRSSRNVITRQAMLIIYVNISSLVLYRGVGAGKLCLFPFSGFASSRGTPNIHILHPSSSPSSFNMIELFLETNLPTLGPRDRNGESSIRRRWSHQPLDCL